MVPSHPGLSCKLRAMVLQFTVWKSAAVCILRPQATQRGGVRWYLWHAADLHWLPGLQGDVPGLPKREFKRHLSFSSCFLVCLLQCRAAVPPLWCCLCRRRKDAVWTWVKDCWSRLWSPQALSSMDPMDRRDAQTLLFCCTHTAHKPTFCSPSAFSSSLFNVLRRELLWV